MASRGEVLGTHISDNEKEVNETEVQDTFSEYVVHASHESMCLRSDPYRRERRIIADVVRAIEGKQGGVFTRSLMVGFALNCRLGYVRKKNTVRTEWSQR